MVEVIVSRLGLDSGTNAFVVILEERGGDRVLPIWIGRAEAEAIAAHLEGVHRERPMTHDLLQSVLVTLGGTLERVNIARVHDGTYFAELLVSVEGDTHVVDARPSDSIALALRLSAPLYAAEDLLQDLGTAEAAPPPEEEEPAPEPEFGSEARDAHLRSAEQLKRHLEQLRPEDFGKFRL